MASACEGWMWKKGKVRGNFKRRFFRLMSDSLSYHKTPTGPAKGSIPLNSVFNLRTARDHTKYRKAGPHCQFALEVETSKRTWALIPETIQDQQKWVDALVPCLSPSFVAADLLQASRDRSAASAGASKGRGKGKGGKASSRRERKAADSDDDYDDDLEAGRGRAPSDDSYGSPAPGGTGKKPRRGLFGRRKATNVEMTATELERTKEELAKAKEENRQLQAALRSAGKGKRGKGKWNGMLEEPLLGSDDSDYDDHETKPGCCSRCCFCIRKNLSLFVLFVVNILLLALGAAIIAVAYYVHTHSKEFLTAVPDLKNALLMLLAMGAVLIILALMGLLGACCRKKWWARCFLYIFATVMGLVVIVEVAGAALMFKTSGSLKTLKSDAIMDAANTTMQLCCQDYSFNGHTVAGHGDPDSTECDWIPRHIVKHHVCTVEQFKDDFLDLLSKDIKPLAIVAVVVALVEIFCVYAACMLAREGKRRAVRDKRSARSKSGRATSKSKGKGRKGGAAAPKRSKGKRRPVDSDGSDY